MKQLTLVSAFFLLLGCGSGEREHTESGDSLSDRIIYSDADSTRVQDSIVQAEATKVISDSLVPDSVATEPTYRAYFAVWYTYAYCGGARPTEEMEAEHQKLQPLTSSTLKFKNHHTGKEYFLKTSPRGEAVADMEEGKYDVFFTKDINSGIETGFDPKCSAWLNQLLLTVKVTARGKMQDVNVHFVCNPCDEQMKKRP